MPPRKGSSWQVVAVFAALWLAVPVTVAIGAHAVGASGDMSVILGGFAFIAFAMAAAALDQWRRDRKER